MSAQKSNTNFVLGSNSRLKLVGVSPILVKVVERAISISAIDFSVIEGLRSIQRQKELVAAGKSQTMTSHHITGEAVDLCPYVNGKLDWNTESNFTVMAEAMRQAAIDLKVPITWGRAWTSRLNDRPSAQVAMDEYVALRRSQKRTPFMDGPHFQLPK